MKNYQVSPFPRSRIATFDIYALGQTKHHISVILECDVTDSRRKLKERKSANQKVSFTAWLLHVIATTIEQYPEAAAYLRNKRKLILFDDVNISIVVEKFVEGKKVPIPLVIRKTQEKSVSEIWREIEAAKNQPLSGQDVVLNEQPKFYEKLYYRLPGILRRGIWRFILRYPKIAYKSMGNVIVTSVGMMGRIDGWFLHKSVHPISFGIGSILKKPRVVDDEIRTREVLNMTILIDHDVIDGAPMARFVQELVRNLEAGEGL